MRNARPNNHQNSKTKAATPPSSSQTRPPASATSKPEHAVDGTESRDNSRSLNLPQAAEEERVSTPLDRYAPTFIPAWLKEVNEDPNYSFEALPDSTSAGQVDYANYALQAWPSPLWRELQSGQIQIQDEEDQSAIESWLPEGGAGEGEALEAEGEETTNGDGISMQPSLSSYADSQSTELTSIPHQQTADGSGADATLSKLPRLESRTYDQHWLPLIREEARERLEELQSYSIYAQRLSIYNQKDNASKSANSVAALYTLAVPGVREERPRLYTGDCLFLRPLRVPPAHNPFDPMIQGVGWYHVVLEARVKAVRAIQGEVVIECPQLGAWIKSGIFGLSFSKFNVTFAPNHRTLDDSASSVDFLGRTLRPASTRARRLQKWLFPSVEDAAAEVRNVRDFEPLSWFDEGLNPEQKAAVASIVLHRREIPFLLSGPPGTGKTKTSVEAVLQIVQRDAHARVLVVAPSNPASDVLAMRLAKRMSPKELYRINDATRTFAEVPEELSAYTCVDQEKGVFVLPPWKDFMKAKVVVTACHDVPILLKCRVGSNTDLGELQNQLLPFLGQGPNPTITLHWTHLVVDEAGQATEPDLAPALACIAPHPLCHSVPSVALVGDVKQLGPAIRSAACRSHDLDVSLLERLSRRPAYAAAMSALQKLGRDLVVTGGQSRGHVSADFVNCGHLIRNYRARHPALLHLPSNLFYADSLVPSSLPTKRSIDLLSWQVESESSAACWTCSPKRGLAGSAQNSPSKQPMRFFDVRSDDEWVDEGISWWNEGECRRIVEICQNLTRNKGLALRPEQISVISPFREQVWRVRLMLRKADLGGVRVGPVEAFQGQECPVVIVSPVRSRARFVQRDRETSSGLIFESKRLNVAMTRAMELLIIVGNAETLGMCEEWRCVIGHAKRNGWMYCIKGKGEDSEGAESDVDETREVSALEYAETVGNGWWSIMTEAYEGRQATTNGQLQRERREPDTLQDQDGATSLLAGRMAAIALQADDIADQL